jgi:NAD(P)-dependent dehydrogenase (short-subunit alcohol dehydrogenase family)
MSEFQDRVLIVTGGGSGIGRATARLFAKDGAVAVILDSNVVSGEQTAELIKQSGGRSSFIETDITSCSSVNRAITLVVERHGKIDILYANAAVQIVRRVDEMTEQEWRSQLDVNLTGTFLCCREVIPVMRSQKRGCIVIASSGHAFQSYPGYHSYAATKGGQLSFMRATALDCAADGIRVNCIVPGATETQLLSEHLERHPAEKAHLLDKIPLGRFASPEDIALGVRMLASDDAAYITGTALVVDGGLLAQG